MCTRRHSLMYSRTLLSAVREAQTNICFFSPRHLCCSISPWFYLDTSALLGDYNKCLYCRCVIMFIRRSRNSALAPGNVRGAQRGSCEKLHRADWSPFFFFCIFSAKCVLISFRGRLSGLLLWRRSLRLDQGQRRGPALGDHARSVR